MLKYQVLYLFCSVNEEPTVPGLWDAVQPRPVHGFLCCIFHSICVDQVILQEMKVTCAHLVRESANILVCMC